MSDTTLELRRLNRLFYASSRVSQAMVQSRSGSEAAPLICQRLVSDGGFVMSWIGSAPTKTDALSPMAWCATTACDLEQVTLLADDGAPVASGTEMVWNDYGVRTQSAAARDFAAKAGLRSGAAFPIECGGAGRGMLALYSHEPNFFGPKEISILGDITANISLGVERMAAEALQRTELEKERSLLRALMDNSSDRIYFKDMNSRFIRCSRAQYERFRTTAQDIVGKSDFDFFGDEHARDAFADEQRIIRTGEGLMGKIERETWRERADSWALTAKMPLRNDAGEVIGTMGISKDFTAIKQAEAELAEMHRQLLEVSRLAGMAEVATSILHNVGNVLNSVNVSCSVVAEKIRGSRVVNVAKVASLLTENATDLPEFFASPKGKQLPSYLSELAAHLTTEREAMLKELQSLTTNIEHIKEIVAAQQSYARTSGLVEILELHKLVDDALEMHKDAMGRHAVNVIRDYRDRPTVMVEKHKVLQILVNLIHNSKYALDDGGGPDKRVILRVEKHETERVRISVIDNGVGIAPENLARVFEHGFTTRKDGHGFGLHSGALTAKELGGTLKAYSDGPGRGATFVLELPCELKKAS